MESIADIEKSLGQIKSIKGFSIFDLTGKPIHSNSPIKNGSDLGRSIVILCDALKKQEAKNDLITWKYSDGMIYLKGFRNGFFMAVTSEKFEEDATIRLIHDSAKKIESYITSTSEKKPPESLLTESELNEIVRKLRKCAVEIEGQWIGWYFDQLVLDLIDIDQAGKYDLKNLIKYVSEHLSGSEKKKTFIEKALNIIGE
ncbi:hypothetical protein JXA84_05840 [candidate division WOR-3 bacterium]|nr:hypothetical protein [candidate division WOR-3 bacterium]